jgi:hypothetical protein
MLRAAQKIACGDDPHNAFPAAYSLTGALAGRCQRRLFHQERAIGQIVLEQTPELVGPIDLLVIWELKESRDGTEPLVFCHRCRLIGGLFGRAPTQASQRGAD